MCSNHKMRWTLDMVRLFLNEPLPNHQLNAKAIVIMCTCRWSCKFSKQNFSVKKQFWFFTTNGRPDLCVVSGCAARLLGADLAAPLRDRKSWRAPNRGMTPTPAPLINPTKWLQRSRQTSQSCKAGDCTIKSVTNQLVCWPDSQYLYPLLVNENSILQR